MKIKFLSLFVFLLFIALLFNPLSKAEKISDEEIDKKIEFFMKIGHMPSVSACVLKNDSIVWSKSYGYYDLKEKKEANQNTIYMVGSISKPIAAIALMQLYEKGLFDLDDNISNYLPFHIYNPYYPKINITFRMLLAHASSLNHADARLFFYFSILNYPNEWLKELLVPGGLLYKDDVWKNAKPGEIEIYSGSNFALIGYIIELMSGYSFKDYCNKFIFEPLEMYNSSFEISSFNINEIAVPYHYIFKKYIPLPIYEIHNSAVAGLKSTICDLSHFLIVHLNQGRYKDKRILNESTINMMKTIQYDFGSDGLSWKFVTFSNGKTYFGHGGQIPGFRSQVWIYSPDNTGILFSYNQYPGTDLREKYRLMGQLEKYSREQLAILLFDIAENYN